MLWDFQSNLMLCNSSAALPTWVSSLACLEKSKGMWRSIPEL